MWASRDYHRAALCGLWIFATACGDAAQDTTAADASSSSGMAATTISSASSTTSQPPESTSDSTTFSSVATSGSSDSSGSSGSSGSWVTSSSGGSSSGSSGGLPAQCQVPDGTPLAVASQERDEILARYLERRPRYLADLDPDEPRDADLQTLAYYHMLARTHVLRGNLEAQFLRPSDAHDMLAELVAMADDLAAFEIGNNVGVQSARGNYAAWMPAGDEDHRGWAYYSENFFGGWPDGYTYDPYAASGTGTYTAIDHTHPPFHSYAIETANVLLALAETAIVLRGYGCELDRADAYAGLVGEVLGHWSTAHYGPHDAGYDGWHYEEYETEVIGGVPHYEDYYAINSNAMMASAALAFDELEGDPSFVDEAAAAAFALKDSTTTLNGAYVWNFGHNNAHWDSVPGGVEVTEDTSHAAWDLTILTWGFLHGGVDVFASDLQAAANTLFDNVVQAPVVNRRIDGTDPYPQEFNYLVAEWSHLAIAIDTHDPPGARALLDEIASVVDLAGYGYYRLLFDATRLRVLAEPN